MTTPHVEVNGKSKATFLRLGSNMNRKKGNVTNYSSGTEEITFPRRFTFIQEIEYVRGAGVFTSKNLKYTSKKKINFSLKVTCSISVESGSDVKLERDFGYDGL
ncbi:hypothetical protein AVEN_163550-1 [Araneus ventricosus]|uniref:Uncharacterized protein n=1 Tax=Araneus ventricosus TaxID=182803 RepID=A0A4Y2QG19_ARAVE|nr:hypothetical protein AVEN_163550-1 [Araneus ventricosus]